MIFFLCTITLASAVVYLETETHDGNATYYGGNVVGNACGFISLPTATFPFGYAAACGGRTFQGGKGCGSCFEVTCLGPENYNPGCSCDPDHPTVVVQCTDQCPECSKYHLDLNPAAMIHVTGDAAMAGTCGVIETQVRRVACPILNTIKILSKSGTSAYWYGLHVDDVAGYGAVHEVKMKDASMSDYIIICNRDQPSYWACPLDESWKPLQAPMSVKLINEVGDELDCIDTISNFNGDTMFDCGQNFDSSTSAPAPPTTASPSPQPTRKPSKSPIVPPPPTAPTSNSACNIRIDLKEESKIWWLAFFVNNICCTTINKVEIKDSSNFQTWQECTLAHGYYAFDAGSTGKSLTPSVSVRITADNGQVKTFTNLLTTVTRATGAAEVQFPTSESFCSAPAPITPTTPSPVTSGCDPIKVILHTGINIWWLAFNIDNVCCGAADTVQIKDAGTYTNWVDCTKDPYFYKYQTTQGSLTTPISVRVTNTNGQVLVLNDIITEITNSMEFTNSQSFDCGASFNVSDMSDKSWYAEWKLFLVIAAACLTVMMCICVWRRRKMNQGMVSFQHTNQEVDLADDDDDEKEAVEITHAEK